MVIAKVNNKNTYNHVYSQIDDIYNILLIQQEETYLFYIRYFIFLILLHLICFWTCINIMPILLFGFIHLHRIIFPANIAQEIMQFDFSCTLPSAFSISINNV